MTSPQNEFLDVHNTLPPESLTFELPLPHLETAQVPEEEPQEQNEILDAVPQPSWAGLHSELLQSIQLSLDGVKDEIAGLKALYIQQQQTNDLNRHAFDRLHKEMTDYKDNFLQRAQEPMYRALISLDDDIAKLQDSQKPITIEDCTFLREQLEDILMRQEVEPFASEGDAFDPSCQKAIKTEPTPDPELHRRVARRLRRGFRLGTRILRPENVVVYVHTPAAPAAETANTLTKEEK